MLKKAVSSLLTLFLLMSLGPVAALAQAESGQLNIKASDPQGAVVPGATVTAKSVERGTEVTTTTNDEGTATISSLQPGLYDVTVTGGGFAPNTQRAQVTVGSRVTLDFSLSATAKGESITVVAGEGGVEVNTQTQELSDVVSGRQITELPTITRNPYALVQLSGNVSSSDDSGRGTGFAINGQRSASTNILLDGGENVDTFTATVGQSVPLDSVQEFRVITSNFSAEYGRASGGIVNVATKAGSNDFHGTLYEFNRVSKLASNSFDDNAQGIAKGVFTRNQFGYSVGGPVKKEKLFFFSSTEWTRIRSTGEVISLVPTPQLLAASNANTKAFFSGFNLVAPISGQIFTVGQVKSLLGLTGSTPFNNLSDNTPAFGQVRLPRATNLGAGTPGDDWQTVGRLDYNWSDKTQIYVRGVYEEGSNPAGTVSFSPYEGFNTGFEQKNQNYLVSMTHSFSSNLVSQSKVNFNRLNQQQPLNGPEGPTLYANATGAVRIAGQLIRLPGYLPTSPGSAIPFGGPQNLLQTYEDLNWTKGNHQFRFGGLYIHIRDNRTFGAYQNAVEVLGNNNNQSFGNLVGGQLASFSVAAFPQGKFPCFNNPLTGARIVTPECTLQTPLTSPNFSRSNRYHEWAAYFNDSWKVKPRFTLNLGIRYEYYGIQHNANQDLDSNFYPGEGADIFQQIENGRILLAKDSPNGTLWNPDRNNFAPRLGFAWDVFGNGTTSLRGGYGMAYERNFGNVTFNVIQNPPNNATVAISAGADVPVGSLPITLDNLGPLAGSGISKSFPAVSLRAVDPDIKNAYAQFWSFSAERQIASNTVVSLEYAGSAGSKLYSIANINRAGAGTFYLGIPRALARINNSGATSINFRGSDGRSRYNAMIASIDSSRLRNLGLHFTARYTYSVTRDNLSNTFSEGINGNFNLGYLDPFNKDLDYGYSEFDARHRLITSWNWEIPHVKDAKGFLNHALNGWELTGIFSARTGAPFTVFDCTLSFNVCSRAILSGPVNFNGDVNHHSVGTTDAPNRYKYIDLSGLTPGEFVDSQGLNEFPPFPANMSKRNQFRGPGFWNLDAGLYKNFRITERVGFQFRFEAYNVFNHANLYIIGVESEVNSGFVPACFGCSGLTQDRRNVQIAGKVIF